MMEFPRMISTKAALAAIGILSLSAVPAQAQNAAAGGALFKQRCLLCHTITPGARGGMAPNMIGVVGRPAASTEFAYSPALKKSGLTWDKATLDAFLTAPGKLVPGTRMVYPVPDAKQRADVIAYLATLKK
jgi:cytochrome c